MIYIVIIISFIHAITLQEAYDDASSYGEYDKYVILNADSTYYWGLGIYEGNVMIDGQGSIVNLDGGTGIWAYGTEDYPCNVDIKFCTIINGEYDAVNYAGTATGSVENCNLVNNDIGIKLMDYSNVNISNSNFINGSLISPRGGFYCRNACVSIGTCFRFPGYSD